MVASVIDFGTTMTKKIKRRIALENIASMYQNTNNIIQQRLLTSFYLYIRILLQYNNNMYCILVSFSLSFVYIMLRWFFMRLCYSLSTYRLQTLILSFLSFVNALQYFDGYGLLHNQCYFINLLLNRTESPNCHNIVYCIYHRIYYE